MKKKCNRNLEKLDEELENDLLQFSKKIIETFRTILRMIGFFEIVNFNFENFENVFVSIFVIFFNVFEIIFSKNYRMNF